MNQDEESGFVGLIEEKDAVPVHGRRQTFDVSDTGCACSLLTDNAHWDAPTWDMLEDARPRLARTIELLGERARGGFYLEALWIGEKPLENVDVTLEELAELARMNAIGTRTRYVVKPRDPAPTIKLA